MCRSTSAGVMSEALGDVLLREAVYLLQHEGAARVLRQAADRTTEGHEALVRLEVRFRRFGGQLPIHIGERQALDRRDQAAAGAGAVTGHGVRGRAQQKGAIAAQGRRAADLIRACERFLQDVVHVAALAEASEESGEGGPAGPQERAASAEPAALG